MHGLAAVTLTHGRIVALDPQVATLVSELDALDVAVARDSDKAQNAYQTTGEPPRHGVCASAPSFADIRRPRQFTRPLAMI